MISIITPIYNPIHDSFLRLINTVKSQTSDDFEWILVDDCSDYPIEDIYSDALKGLNYRILRNKRNLGAGESRNVGLKHFKGDYVLFVDSDDYIEATLISSITRILHTESPDILFFDYIRDTNNGQKVRRTLANQAFGEVDKTIAIISSSTNVCGKVVKRTVLKEGTVFPSIKRYEDWVFMMRVYNNACKFYYLDSPLYHYVDNHRSTVYLEKEHSYKYAFNAFNILLEDNYYEDQIMEALYAREVLYLSIKDNAKCSKKRLKSIVSYYAEYYPKWMNSSYISTFDIKKRVLLGLYRSDCFFAIRLIAFFI